MYITKKFGGFLVTPSERPDFGNNFTKRGKKMIDTVKIYCEIDRASYEKIHNNSIVKTSYDNSTGELFYNITTGFLEGSFDNRLSVRVDSGVKYGFVNKGYCIEIEGSLHKYIKGFNAYDGFYDLLYVCKTMIKITEDTYFIKLPDIENWFLQRCDIAICYDLNNQENVQKYINSLSSCKFPRRNSKFFYNESLYLSGTTTTLKIYNKLLEFRKHDMNKLSKNGFNVFEYIQKIKGFVRFECEIKKKMLSKLYNNEKHIKIINVKYEDLKKVWSDEFMKIIKMVRNDLEIVRSRDKVYDRLMELYKPCKASRLYTFFCSLVMEGEKNVYKKTSQTVYYRNIADLKTARVDFSQNIKFKEEEEDMFYFNPFEYKEVV